MLRGSIAMAVATAWITHVSLYMFIFISACSANDIVLSACWVSRTFTSVATDQTYSFLLSIFDGQVELVNDNELNIGRYHSFTLIESLLIKWDADASENPLLKFKIETKDLWETDRAKALVDMREIGFSGHWVTLSRKNNLFGAEVRLLLRCDDCPRPNANVWQSETLPQSFLMGISQLQIKKSSDYVGGAEIEVVCSSWNSETHRIALSKLAGVSGVVYRTSETHGGVGLFLWRKQTPVYTCALVDLDYGDDEGIGVAVLSYDMVAPVNVSNGLVGKQHSVNLTNCDMTFISCIQDSQHPEFTCQSGTTPSGSILESLLAIVLIIFLGFAYRYILS